MPFLVSWERWLSFLQSILQEPPETKKKANAEEVTAKAEARSASEMLEGATTPAEEAKAEAIFDVEMFGGAGTAAEF